MTFVRIRNLRNKPELNGAIGILGEVIHEGYETVSRRFAPNLNSQRFEGQRFAVRIHREHNPHREQDPPQPREQLLSVKIQNP